jgi:hypothetical protein
VDEAASSVNNAFFSEGNQRQHGRPPVTSERILVVIEMAASVMK